MTTAVAKTTAAAPAPKEPIEAGGQIAAIVPQNIEQAFRLAQALSRAPAALPEELETVHARIMDDLEAGEDIPGTLEAFAMEIAAIRAASPGHGEMIDAAAEKGRAA